MISVIIVVLAILSPFIIAATLSKKQLTGIMRIGIFLMCLTPLLNAQDTIYTVTRTQLMAQINDLRYQQEQFTAMLKDNAGENVSATQLKIMMETQQELSRYAYSFSYINSMFPDLPEEFKRELNYALRDNGQNSERVSKMSKGIEKNTSVKSIVDMFFSVISAFMPQYAELFQMMVGNLASKQ